MGRGKGAGSTAGSKAASKTRSQKGLDLSMAMAEETTYAVKSRTEMVHRILEGLRDEAFDWPGILVSNP